MLIFGSIISRAGSFCFSSFDQLESYIYHLKKLKLTIVMIFCFVLLSRYYFCVLAEMSFYLQFCYFLFHCYLLNRLLHICVFFYAFLLFQLCGSHISLTFTLLIMCVCVCLKYYKAKIDRSDSRGCLMFFFYCVCMLFCISGALLLLLICVLLYCTFLSHIQHNYCMCFLVCKCMCDVVFCCDLRLGLN